MRVRRIKRELFFRGSHYPCLILNPWRYVSQVYNCPNFGRHRDRHNNLIRLHASTIPESVLKRRLCSLRRTRYRSRTVKSIGKPRPIRKDARPPPFGSMQPSGAFCHVHCQNCNLPLQEIVENTVRTFAPTKTRQPPDPNSGSRAAPELPAPATDA